jgi:hypothetical protein
MEATVTAEELKQGVLDTFLRIADRFGVPCVMLAVILYFGREAAVALHGTVVQPVVKSHVDFLEATSETLKEIGHTQQQQAVTLQELSHGQRELSRVVKAMVSGSDPAPN